MEILLPASTTGAQTNFVQLVPTNPMGSAWKAIVDFKPTVTGAPNLVTRTEIRILNSAETSKKGVVRLMMKVSMPYSALYPSDTASGSSNLKFSSARSTGELSMHTVLTLPKELVNDIVQQKAGSAGQEVASSHIRFLAGLMTLAPLTQAGQSCGGDATSTRSLVADTFALCSSGSDNGIPVVSDDGNTAAGLLTAIELAARGLTPLANQMVIGVTSRSE